jgi:hypothetical protein
MAEITFPMMMIYDENKEPFILDICDGCIVDSRAVLLFSDFDLAAKFTSGKYGQGSFNTNGFVKSFWAAQQLIYQLNEIKKLDDHHNRPAGRQVSVERARSARPFQNSMVGRFLTHIYSVENSSVIWD